MAINPNEINIKNIVELIQSSSIKDNDLLVIGQGIYARKSTILELYNKFGVPSILTSLNSLQFQINQLNNTVGNSVLYSPQVKTAQQKADARNNLDVYSKTETQTVVNSAIVNLGNVVNSVNGVNVDNTDPKNPIIAEFRPIADYNNDMLNKADIDGNLTTGGIWWQDQVLSDRFANYKQVWTALTNNTIEWGNIELDKHIFLVDDINGLKIKVGGSEGTIWNTLNLTDVSQLNNDAGYLQANDLDGFIYDVQYNSATHTITFYQQNEPNIVIDLPIEQLIKGVQLVGNDLIFTFEDGSTVTVPLNTLLVGVVKSVNGLTPNSQGEIILNVTDIPNLSSELANKLDIRMAGLVNNLTQPEKDAILTKLGVVNNIVQVLGLSGNTITLSNGGGSISLNIANIGGLQNALDGKANTSGSNLTNIPNWQSVLGINTSWNLQQVTTNGNVTDVNEIILSDNLNNGYIALQKSRNLQGYSGTTGALDIYLQKDGGNVGVGTTNPQAKLHVNGNAIVSDATASNHAITLGQLNTVIGGLPTPIYYTASNGVVLIGNDFQLNASTLNSLSLANSALQVENDPIFTASPAYGITSGNITSWNAKQNQLTNGLHTTLSSNQINVAFDVNTYVKDKSNNDRLLFGNTSSTDIVIHGAVANGDFKVKDSTGADMFRMNGSNKVPYFPQLPAPQTMDGNLAIFDTGDGLWKHTTKISDLVTTSVLSGALGNYVNKAGDTMTGSLNINVPNNHILLSENNNVEWQIQSVSGEFNIVETGVAQRFRIIEGALTAQFNGFDMWHAGNFNPANYALLSQVYTQAQSLALFVGLNGVQTIADTKTFSSSPIVPTATLNGHAVNLGQLNSIINGLPQPIVYTGSNGINVTGTVISPTYGTTANTIAEGNDARINNGQTAFGWGNHALAGYLTSASVGNFFEKESINSSSNVNSHDLGLFTVDPTTLNLPIPRYGIVYCYKANASWFFQQFKDENGNIWERRVINPTNVDDWQPWVKTNANSSIDNYALLSQVPTNNNQLANGANYTTLPLVQSWIATQNFSTQTLTAGANVQIVGNVISATDTNTTYTAGTGLSLTGTVFGQTITTSGTGTFVTGVTQTADGFQVNLGTPPNTTYTGSNGINVTGTVISPTYGTTANTIAQGNDARFHDAVTLGTANGLSLAGQVLSLGLASASANGALSSTDWNTFNSKVSANNGTFTVQGTGALTGTGSTSANATANTTADLDLTQATKDDIQQGVNANTIIPSIVDGVDFINIPSNGNYNIPIEKKKTIINVSNGVLGAALNVDDGLYDGYELAINGCTEWQIELKGNVQDKCQNQGSVSHNSSVLYWWSADNAMWIQAI